MKRGSLVVLLDGQVVGQLMQSAGRKLELLYDEAWRASDEAFPLSSTG